MDHICEGPHSLSVLRPGAQTGNLGVQTPEEPWQWMVTPVNQLPSHQTPPPSLPFFPKWLICVSIFQGRKGARLTSQLQFKKPQVFQGIRNPGRVRARVLQAGLQE